MNDDETLQEEVKKKVSGLRYAIPSIVIMLLFLTVFICVVYILVQNYPASGDSVIRLVTGKMLKKDPNSLDSKDFLTITTLDLSEQTLPDIRLLRKFRNLKELNLSRLKIPRTEMPKWKAILVKMHIIKVTTVGSRNSLTEASLLNLRPLKKLTNLETLNLNYTPIESIAPLSSLKKLTELDIFGAGVFDLKPVGKLSNLGILNVGKTKITDLKPVQKLTKLHRIHIYNTDIADLKPLMNLSNLDYVDMRKCKNITDSEVENLQQSLPKLVIFVDANQ
ncbi:MAG: hypothetical protein JW787_07590 [Sedimentisphaerales bacterium]|nr:hypothetical protein [Sedimentisphaerales bacterium]